MAGSPKKRAKREREARAAEAAAREQHPNAVPGSPEWVAFMTERRRQKADERRRDEQQSLVPEPEGGETQEQKDERVALNILRDQMAAKDEKIAQVAAIKLLEHRRRDRDQDGEEEEGIVYETAFAPEAFELLREIARDEGRRELVAPGG